jgi:neopullulanase
MNYIFTWNALAFFGGRTIRRDWSHEHLRLDPLDADMFARGIDHMHSLYPWEINYSQMNLLDSHDIPRALYLMGEDKSALRLCALFQMTMPGAPCIYYGDEIGLSSAGDPYCREAFPWERESEWDWQLLSFYRDVTDLRHDFPVLRTGSFKFIFDENEVVAFHRKLDEQEAVVIFNAGMNAADIDLPSEDITAKEITRVWPKGEAPPLRVGNDKVNVNIPPRNAVVLISQ